MSSSIEAGKIEEVWLTSDGRVHTVALSDPTYLFAADSLDSINALLTRTPPSEVEHLVDSVLDEVLPQAGRQAFEAARETEFEAQSPPPTIFVSLVADLGALRTALASIDWRWRLDVAMAIQDLADALDG